MMTFNVRFHFIKDQFGNNFNCTSENPVDDVYFGRYVSDKILESSNHLLANTFPNATNPPNDGTQLPNGGDTKIRVKLKTDDNENCSGVFFWESEEDYLDHNQEFDNSAINVLFLNKVDTDDDNNTNIGGLATSRIEMYNLHYNIYNAENFHFLSNYGWVFVHEVFHHMGLSHSFSFEANNPCLIYEEICVGGLTDEELYACQSSGNNIMSYSGQPFGFTLCQWAEIYNKDYCDTKNWITYSGLPDCNKIVIDENTDNGNRTITWSNTTEIICSDIEIKSGYELILDNTNLKMNSGSRIIIHRGARLIFRGLSTELESWAVDGSWEGIYVVGNYHLPQPDFDTPIDQLYSEGSGILVIENGQGISDANIAIRTHGPGSNYIYNGGLVHSSGQRFIIKNSGIGIEVRQYLHENRSNLAGLNMNSCQIGLKIIGNQKFNIDSFECVLNDEGVVSINSEIQITNSRFIFNEIGIQILNNQSGIESFIGQEFNGNVFNANTSIDIAVQGGSYLEGLSIEDNSFLNGLRGIVVWGDSNVRIKSNNFSGYPRSILMLQTEINDSELVCNNIFGIQSEGMGIGFLGNNSQSKFLDNTINTTSNDQIGCMIRAWDGENGGVHPNQTITSLTGDADQLIETTGNIFGEFDNDLVALNGNADPFNYYILQTDDEAYIPNFNGVHSLNDINTFREDDPCPSSGGVPPPIDPGYIGNVIHFFTNLVTIINNLESQIAQSNNQSQINELQSELSYYISYLNAHISHYLSNDVQEDSYANDVFNVLYLLNNPYFIKKYIGHHVAIGAYWNALDYLSALGNGTDHADMQLVFGTYLDILIDQEMAIGGKLHDIKDLADQNRLMSGEARSLYTHITGYRFVPDFSVINAMIADQTALDYREDADLDKIDVDNNEKKIAFVQYFDTFGRLLHMTKDLGELDLIKDKGHELSLLIRVISFTDETKQVDKIITY